MNWTNETIIRFLGLYQMHPCIWNPKNEFHKNKNRLNEAWDDIMINLGEPCSVSELKMKKESLMSAYRGYRTKIKRSKSSGSGVIYRPTWFAYALMHSFLGNIYKCNASVTIEDNKTKQNYLEAEDSNTDQDDNNINTLAEESDGSYQNYPDPDPSAPRLKRRHPNPHELHQAKNQMDQAFNIFKAASRRSSNDDDNECCLFGKLIAKKMRKLSEDRRDLMMIKISQLLFDEYHGHEMFIVNDVMQD